MADINAQMIKELREKTNAGMMDCKAALVEAGGDMEEAETILRKKGIAAAGKKASRETREGLIAAHIDADSRVGSLVEINCETDFVAKNDNFVSFVKAIAEHVAASTSGASTVEELGSEDFAAQPGTSVDEALKAKIAELGENIVFKRFVRLAVADGTQGVVASYIHLAGKVGVLVEVGCEKSESTGSDKFRDLVKDVTLQIAASHPLVVSRDQVDPALVEKERDVYRDQVKGKPENIIEKIVDGKLDKFYSSVALLEQGYIKDPDHTISDLFKKLGTELGDTLTVRRFARYAIGEAG